MVYDEANRGVFSSSYSLRRPICGARCCTEVSRLCRLPEKLFHLPLCETCIKRSIARIGASPQIWV